MLFMWPQKVTTMHEDAGGGRTLVELRLEDGRLRRFWGCPGERTTAYRLGGGPVELLIVRDVAEIAHKDHSSLVSSNQVRDALRLSRRSARQPGSRPAVEPLGAGAHLVREMLDFRDETVALSLSPAPEPRRAWGEGKAAVAALDATEACEKPV